MEHEKYLTSVGNASNLQNDRETKRTPAGVAGGRLVISWSSCSASSSVGLEEGTKKKKQLNASCYEHIHSFNQQHVKILQAKDSRSAS